MRSLVCENRRAFLFVVKNHHELKICCHRQVLPQMSEMRLTGRQRKILRLINESPTITGKKMSEILSVSQRTIERDLSVLQKLDVLKREGKDNDGVWIVI